MIDVSSQKKSFPRQFRDHLPMCCDGCGDWRKRRFDEWTTSVHCFDDDFLVEIADQFVDFSGSETLTCRLIVFYRWI